MGLSLSYNKANQPMNGLMTSNFNGGHFPLLILKKFSDSREGIENTKEDTERRR